MEHSTTGITCSFGKISLKEDDKDFDKARFVLNKLNEDRISSNCFCDFTIKTPSRNFSVHKCVVGVMSEFFKRMFISNMKESFENSATLEGIRDEVVGIVIEFMYNNDISIKMDNAFDLLKAADYLQMPLLKTHSIKFLVQNVSPKNIFQIFDLANLYSTDNFVEKCKAYISKNLAQIIKEKSFLSLSFDKVLRFIELKEDSVSEHIIFECIVDWVEHDKASRKEHFFQLFKLLDLKKVSKLYINTAMTTNDLVLECHECSKLLLVSLKNHFFVEQCQTPNSEKTLRVYSDIKTQDKSQTCTSNSSTLKEASDKTSKGIIVHSEGVVFKSTHSSPPKPVQPQESSNITNFSSNVMLKSASANFLNTEATVVNANKPKKTKEFLIVGGEYSTSSVIKFSADSKKWFRLPDSDCGENIYSGIVVINNYLYVIGGRELDSKNAYNALYRWNHENQSEWREKAEMNTGRYKFGCAVLSNMIYVAGGMGHKTDWLCSVESYNIRRNKWTERPDMNLNRGDCRLVECRGKLYAIGGCQSPKVFHGSIEILRPNNSDWDMGPPMSTPRAGLAAVALNNEIYAIGGQCNKDEYLATVEKFSSGAWRNVASLKFPRAGHGACVMDGKIYVAGGSNCNGPVKYLEMYDPLVNKWQFLPAFFHGDSRGTSMAVL